MEVKEIIEYLEKHKPIPLFARSKEDYNEYIGKDIEKIDKMITLLKSLEAENKKLKAYEEMWKELKPTDDYECLILEERHLLSKMGNLENKYLGGGE